jgi:hypothetical protein
MKAHFSAHPRQGFGQEMGGSHPVFEYPEKDTRRSVGGLSFSRDNVPVEAAKMEPRPEAQQIVVKNPGELEPWLYS